MHFGELEIPTAQSRSARDTTANLPCINVTTRKLRERAVPGHSRTPKIHPRPHVRYAVCYIPIYELLPGILNGKGVAGACLLFPSGSNKLPYSNFVNPKI